MKEILCFGDSNTYGLIPGTTRRYNRETRWTGILSEKLYDKGYRIIEEGLCGRTSVFDDAITFKIALMVVKYMKYMESKDTY